MCSSNFLDFTITTVCNGNHSKLDSQQKLHICSEMNIGWVFMVIADGKWRNYRVHCPKNIREKDQKVSCRITIQFGIIDINYMPLKLLKYGSNIVSDIWIFTTSCLYVSWYLLLYISLYCQSCWILSHIRCVGLYWYATHTDWLSISPALASWDLQLK